MNTATLNPVVQAVTERIIERSRDSRAAYLARIRAAAQDGPARTGLACSNLAHGVAACGGDKDALRGDAVPNIAIVSSYNDMLSAHQPFEDYPARIKAAARAAGAVAQFAGGTPAMCDGVTQGEDGMDLSLFSRDVIALSTAVALSHDMFDAALCLGVCDKIIPGLLIGALSFGHLPILFVPAGPMPSGLPNPEKARIREAFALGKIGRDELLAAECASYHSAGTCTFYGTANSNQMMMEFLGLQMPGGSFVNPGTALRDALTEEAVRAVLRTTRLVGGENYRPIGEIVDEKAIVNGIAGLLATGGSTNHTLHIVAIAQAAGVKVDWTDFAELSSVVPLLSRVYPNGTADVNHFHAAGGLGFVMRELLDAGLVHEDVLTFRGQGLSTFLAEPFLQDGDLTWREASSASGDEDVLRPVARPFDPEGGVKLVKGNIGRAVVKASAVDPEYRRITAPARVFHSQDALKAAFQAGELTGDMVAVVTHQGPKANGMPELHKLTPFLGILQNQGHRVALVTDGRMSGASGKVLAAIHTTPEALDGGFIARVRDGDLVTVDAETGVLHVEPAGGALEDREALQPDLAGNQQGMGRELFAAFRRQASGAEDGASIFEDIR